MTATCGQHPGAENHCLSGACGECWLCRSEPPDEGYLLTLAAERVARLSSGYDKCRLCGHGWHGMRCTALGDNCTCELAPQSLRTLDGPFCSRCGLESVPTLSEECPTCLSERGRP